MEFKHEIMDNGLDIIGEVNTSAKSAAVGFFVKTGARDETKQINGVSHFLEHMLFKGTDTLSATQVNEAFDRTGSQFNAATSEENTIFYAAVLPEFLNEITILWSKLMSPALRQDDFTIEKNVIKEEIAMYQDMPSFYVVDLCKNLYFGEHPCANSVLGSVEAIDNLALDQMKEYWSKHYSPNNMILAVAGNLDWKEIVKLARENCSAWQNQQALRDTRPHTPSSKTRQIEKANLTCRHICLASQSVSAQDQTRFAASVLATIIGDGTGSRYFWELVDKAIAETATMHLEDMDGTGTMFSYLRCSTDNTQKVLEIVAKIFEDLAKNGVTEEETLAAKNKTLSALVIKNEIPMGRLVDLGFNWTYRKEYRSVQQDIDDIKAVTVDNVNSIIHRFSLSEFTQVTLGPPK